MKKLTILLGSLVVATNLYAFLQSSNPSDAIDEMQDDVSQIQTQVQNMFQFGMPVDLVPNDVCSANADRCFDAGIRNNNEVYIKTKVAGVSGGFQLQLRHHKGCGWGWQHHIGVALVDNLTGKLITEPKEIAPNVNPTDDSTNSDEEVISATFNVANAYRNVSVRFFHLKPTQCNHHQFRWMHQFQEAVQNTEQSVNDIIGEVFMLPSSIQCYEVNSSNMNDFTNFPYWGEKISCDDEALETLNQDTDELKSTIDNKTGLTYNWRFRYAVPADDTCYTIEEECGDTPYISQSSDNFAIRPSYIQATLPANIKANTPTKISVEVKNASGEIITNYNNSSANLKVTFTDSNGNNVDAQYAFDIQNGVGSGTVIFPKPVNGVQVNIVDEHFADVDITDTDEDDRKTDILPGTSSTSDVVDGGSKYWAGVGTNEVENNPRKNTIDTTIKQNVNKDLHFQKMGW